MTTYGKKLMLAQNERFENVVLKTPSAHVTNRPICIDHNTPSHSAFASEKVMGGGLKKK